MKKFFICLTFGLIFSQQLAQSQEIEDKNVLIVWGGWEGHNPKLFSDIVEDWLIKNNANVTISHGLDPYSDIEYLMKFDLIIQSVTMSEISTQQEKNLVKVVRSGVGFAGAHGGLIDSFRNNTAYQFMTGGQWVEHPGGMVKFKVKLVEDKFNEGIKDFEIYTEQYYLHFDPNVEVLATTSFNGTNYPWIKGVEMPVVWKKNHGKGKIFYISLGHDPNEFKRYKEAWELLTRGFIWASSN